MDFDIVFLDTTSPKYYDRITLEKEALGGTEASVIRVAEGLGKLGLKVAVIEARVKDYFAPIIGQYAYFLHGDDSEQITCRHYIQVRANTNPQLFQGAKKYIWLHDVTSKDREGSWVDSLKEYGIELIGVSKWHAENIEESTNYNKITYIHNPVPDEIFSDGTMSPSYDPNLLVWTASPHKGLDGAINLFREMRAHNPKLQLIIFNPGYMKLDYESISILPGVSVYGSMSCKQVWSILRKALCVFYPTQYKETFGLVAAEANALGVPIATNPVAGLLETTTKDQTAENLEAVSKMVLDWSKNGRPKVLGNPKFRESNVIMDWVQFLAK